MTFLGVTGNFMSVGYMWSAQYTIMSHASIFNSLGGAIIVLVRLILRKFVHKLELLGTLIALLGCTVILFDAHAEKMDSENQNIPLGDAIGIIGSVGSALYFT